MMVTMKKNILKYFIIILNILFSLGLLFLYRYLPLCPDHFDYEYVAGVCLGGGSLYKDAGDNNFPGGVALHVLARLAFGDSMWSYRTLDYINLIIFCLAIYFFLSRRQGRSAAAMFVPLYQAMYVVSSFWIAGERDILATHLVLVAGFLFLERIGGGHVAWCYGVGALVCLAMLLKPTYLGYLAILLLIDLSLRGRTGRGLATIARDHARIFLAAGALAASVAAWGWASGVLDDWFENVILFNSQAYASRSLGMPSILASLAALLRMWWYWYTAPALVGGLLWWRSGDRPSLLVILGALAMVLGSALAQGKGFTYHFGGVLTVLGLLAANCLAWLGRAALTGSPRRRPLMRIAFAATALVVLIGLGSKFSREYRRQFLWHLRKISIYEYYTDGGQGPLLELATLARDHTAPGDTILAWNDNSMMIPALAHRRLPVRFVPPHIITQAVPPFRGARRWQDEWEAALREHPPRLIVLPDSLRDPWPDGPRAVRVVREMVETRYRVLASRGGYTCFEWVR
jgi:hypothetical protein